MCSCVVVFMRRACPFQNLNVLVCAQRREPHHLQHCVANHLRFAAQHGPRLNEVWPDIRTRSKPRRFSFLFFCRPASKRIVPSLLLSSYFLFFNFLLEAFTAALHILTSGDQRRVYMGHHGWGLQCGGWLLGRRLLHFW